MLIRSVYSKQWIFRSFLSIDRKVLEQQTRSLSSFRANTSKLKYPLVANKFPCVDTTKINTLKPQWRFSHHSSDESKTVPDAVPFDEACSETLESLTEYFEQLVETCPDLKQADVNYSDGVLTVQLGPTHGTYVINRQTPNRQIWLSSPSSGPKRYDLDHGQWIYRHDGISLHQLLDREIGNIVKHDVDFSRCSFSGTQE